MMARTLIAAFAAACLGWGQPTVAAACSHGAEAGVVEEACNDAEKIELGKRVYRQQRCQVCHSIDGVGSRRSPLDGVGSRLTEEQVRLWIVDPKKMDPKVRKRSYDLAADELEALVAYMLSLKAAE